MRSTTLSILITSITTITCITACTETDDDVSTDESVAALQDPCTADKVEFKDYYTATSCAKSNPGLFQVAVGAIVKAGGSCTAVDDVRACTSIEPIKDDQTLRISWWPIRCTKSNCHPDPIAGLGYCALECCINGVNGPICFKNDHVWQ